MRAVAASRDAPGKTFTACLRPRSEQVVVDVRDVLSLNAEQVPKRILVRILHDPSSRRPLATPSTMSALTGNVNHRRTMEHHITVV